MSHAKWNTERIRRIFLFLGHGTVLLFSLSFFLALSVFVIELLFAYALQVFLSALGITADQPKIAALANFSFTSSQAAILVGTIVIFRALLIWAQSYFQMAACYRFSHKLRTRIIDWVFDQESISIGEVITSYGDKSNGAGLSILHLQTLIFQAAIAIALSITLFVMIPQATVVSILLFSIVIPPLRIITKKTGGEGEQITDLIRISVRRLVQGLKNLLFIRIYSLEAQEKAEHHRLLGSALRGHLNYFVLSNFSNVLPNAVGIVILCGVIVWVQKSGNIGSPSTLLAYFYLFFRFLQTVAGFAQAFANFTFQLPGLEYFGRWWLEHSLDSPLKTNLLNKKPESEFKLTGPLGWDVQNLKFRYPTSNKTIFDNLSFKINPGESFGIIGPSGVGKSTLTSLFLGQLSAESGNLLLIDQKQNSVSLQDVKSQFLSRVGFVGPDAFIFDGSIRENLLYGIHGSPTDQEIRNALELAQCQFVWEQENGLNHHLSDQGSGLSAGQKQRLGLARALLRKPAVLVLDEATSNLDISTERSLISTLQNLRGKVTLVIITHRETLLTILDRVLLLPSLEIKSPDTTGDQKAGAQI